MGLLYYIKLLTVVSTTHNRVRNRTSRDDDAAEREPRKKTAVPTVRVAVCSKHKGIESRAKRRGTRGRSGLWTLGLDLDVCAIFGSGRD